MLVLLPIVIGNPLTSAPLDPSAAIELADTDGGFLPNRLTTEQRDAIENPATGLLIWNTDTQEYEGNSLSTEGCQFRHGRQTAQRTRAFKKSAVECASATPSTRANQPRLCSIRKRS